MFFRSASLITLVGFVSLASAESVGKFRVQITGLDDAQALSNAQHAVALYQQSLQSSDTQRLAEYEWQRLLETAPSELQDAIRPYGYYQSRASLALQDKHNVTLAVTPGERVVVSKRQLQVQGEAGSEDLIRQWLDEYPLREGDPLIQPDYDAAKSELNKRLRRLGYFDAEYTAQSIRIDESLTAATINLQVDSGPRYRYGDIDIVWRDETQQGSYTEELIERYLSIQKGDEFDSQQLQALQSRFTNSAYFSYAEVRPQIGSASDRQVPLQLSLEAPKRYAYGASLGVGTDTGPRTGISYEDRRFNPHGHRLQVTASVSEIRQSLISNYIIPRNSDPRDGITLFASIVDENSDARDSKTTAAGIDISKSLSQNSQFSYGVSLREERFAEDGVLTTNQLVLPSLSWQTVSADNLRDPNRGFRLSTTLLGASEDLGSGVSLLQLNVNAKAVYRIGHGRLLGRLTAGQTWIAEQDTLPASLAYFVGGDYSVRGYDFESIGVETEKGELRGGNNSVATSIEYEQAVRGAFSLAAFVDAGDAYDDKNEIDLKLGVGVGVRWRLPFGAIRLDVAQAQDLPGKPARVHFTFGTDL